MNVLILLIYVIFIVGVYMYITYKLEQDNITSLLNKIDNDEGELVTVKEAADLLNVSKKFVMKLIEDEEIPSCKTGITRQMYKSDVLIYKVESLKKRRETLQRLADDGQDSGIGY